MHEHPNHYIDGRWEPPASGGTIEVRSPSTEEIVGVVAEGTVPDIDRAVAAARRAFDDGPWPRLSVDERCDLLAAAAASLGERIAELGTIGAQEIGMPHPLATMVHGAAPIGLFQHTLATARRFPLRRVEAGMMGPAEVIGVPVGVVGAIVPWNYPLVLTINKVIPALAMGCTVVLKPAPDAPLSALVLAEAFDRAGLPPGVCNVVVADREASERLVVHPDVDKISFTGSTAVGKRIMALCAQDVRRVTLELGGKSACVLLDDADLDAAIPAVATQLVVNSGQTCAAQTRLLAPRSRYDEVVERLAAQLAQVQVGDPFQAGVTMGPLVSAVQRERVEGYLAAGVAEGAKVALGGGRPAGLDRGHFVEPTVFAGVDNAMTIAREEIFGPVIGVIPHGGDDEALAIANDSPYGLAAAVWSSDGHRAAAAAHRLRAGAVQINGASFDLGVPFGGFKQSGIGREGGDLGLASYLEFSSVFGLPAS